MAMKELRYSDVERARIEQRLKGLRDRVTVIEAGGGGSYTLDDGTAATTGAFTLDDGAAA